MPIIAQVGRKKFSVRLLIAGIYVVLGLGALSILYPFALMLSSSLTTRLDFDRFDVIPMIMKGHAFRFVGYLAHRYGREDWASFQGAYRDPQMNFWDDLANDPRAFLDRQKFGAVNSERMENYRAFVQTLQNEELGLHHMGRAAQKYDTEVYVPLARGMTTAERVTQLGAWLPGNGSLLQHAWEIPATPAYQRFLDFRATLPAEDRLVITGRALWYQWLQTNWSLKRVNEALQSNYESILDVPFLQPELREEFFKSGVPARLKGRLPEFEYAKFLKSDKEWVDLPIAEFDYYLFTKNEPSKFWDLLSSNYSAVVTYLFTKGSAALNTVILVVLSIVTALTINPIAAYILARFKLSATPAIILFCLATSAFPAEVAMIPSFLLLRDLGLLNTFAALVLPTAASGFSIFLLKGFFESLPSELYEAAEIDGAGEIRKFAQITMPLSAPILAVMALGAFTAAYTGFMWAFLVCQKEEIWTIMVWLFQFQQSQAEFGNASVGMASLVVASLPTFLVFLFCQKIIMRGIIVPSMK